MCTNFESLVHAHPVLADCCLADARTPLLTKLPKAIRLRSRLRRVRLTGRWVDQSDCVGAWESPAMAAVR